MGTRFSAAVVRVERRGRLRYERAFGRTRDDAPGLPCFVDTRFDLASITKVFVATVALAQVARGALVARRAAGRRRSRVARYRSSRDHLATHPRARRRLQERRRLPDPARPGRRSLRIDRRARRRAGRADGLQRSRLHRARHDRRAHRGPFARRRRRSRTCARGELVRPHTGRAVPSARRSPPPKPMLGAAAFKPTCTTRKRT